MTAKVASAPTATPARAVNGSGTFRPPAANQIAPPVASKPKTSNPITATNWFLSLMPDPKKNRHRRPFDAGPAILAKSEAGDRRQKNYGQCAGGA
jgi:hypothetical protein